MTTSLVVIPMHLKIFQCQRKKRSKKSTVASSMLRKQTLSRKKLSEQLSDLYEEAPNHGQPSMNVEMQEQIVQN